jgi:hypothetical protein
MDTRSSPATSASGGAHLIQRIEQAVYLLIGALLVLTLVLALAGAVKILWDGLKDGQARLPSFS